MHHFRVKLHRVQPSSLVLHCRDRANRRVSNALKAFRQAVDAVGVAHPADIVFFDAVKEDAFGVFDFGFAVFGNVGVSDFAAKLVRHKLRAVANAENGYAQIKYFGIHSQAILAENAVRPTGENYADRVFCFHLFCRNRTRHQFGINVQVPDSSCDELVVLSAEIDDDYVLCHNVSPKKFNR